MTILKHLQLFLVSHGVVRSPTVPGAAAPMWLSPAFGVPAPGQTPRGGDAAAIGDPVVVGAYLAPGVPTGRHDGGLRIPSVDLRYRTKRDEQAIEKDNQIRALLHDERAYMLNGLNVQESLQSRELQLLEVDEFGYTYTSQYTFWCFASDYAQV